MGKHADSEGQQMAALRDVIVRAEPSGLLLPHEEGSPLKWEMDSSTSGAKQKDGAG